MKKFAIFLIAAMLLLPLPQTAFAQDADTVCVLVDEQGMVLTTMAVEVGVDDEYISGDNRLYKVISVEGDKAVLRDMGEEPGPNYSQQVFEPYIATAGESKAAKPLIAMYCTHNDESYENADGTESSEDGKGGILNVAEELKANLESNGVEVLLSEDSHYPHDAGAYRRSQRTALELLKSNPYALIDVHRDGIPDPSEYVTEVEGDETTMVRLLVGRRNPNAEANRNFAKIIKSVADEKYPGLVKDIFVGKGNYNQELAPNSILLEFGTHTSDKEEVLESTKYMANVLTTAIFGAENLNEQGGGESGAASDGQDGASGSAEGQSETNSGSGAASNGGTQQNNSTQTQPKTIRETNSGGAWTALWIVLGIAVVGVIVFALASGGFSGMGHRLARTASEVTGGLIGKKPEDGERPNPNDDHDSGEM